MPLDRIENLTTANKENVMRHVKKAALVGSKVSKPELKKKNADCEEPLMKENPRFDSS